QEEPEKRLVPLSDKRLLRHRAIIETINDQLKNISNIEHSRQALTTAPLLWYPKNDRTFGHTLAAKTGEETKRMRANSRDLVLQAALELFSKQGYDGTSIDDIRQAACFKSKASLYTHFTSKEEVAAALHRQIRQNQRQYIAHATMHASDNPLQRLT